MNMKNVLLLILALLVLNIFKSTTKRLKRKVRRQRGFPPHHRLSGKVATLFRARVRRDFGVQRESAPRYLDIVNKCSKKGRLRGKVLYFDTTKFILNEPFKCLGKVHLLIAVHSFPPFSHRRNEIRRTWGSVRQVRDKRIKLVFFLGLVADKATQSDVENESHSYRDIVQRDFVESYRNMTRKHLTVIEWVAKYCPNSEYVMKTDDDTFTDIFHAVRLLSVLKVPGFYCTATTGAKPERKSNGYLKKWRVTKEEYPDKTYPAYCEGLGYIMNTTVAKKLYWCAMFNNFFWIDDVYVGGVLPQKLGIPRLRFWNGHGHDVMKPSHAAGNVVDYIFLMAGNNEFMASLWRRLWKTVVVNSIDI